MNSEEKAPLRDIGTAETLRLEVSPSRIEMGAGDPPVEITVTLENLGDVVEQYVVDLVGLEPDWYTAPGGTVGIFPQDHDDVRISVHPPRRPGVQAGSYSFRVRVRSRGSAQEMVAQGRLELRGYAVFRLDIMPHRQTARRRGRYQVQLANTGNADTQLFLDARDAEEGCRFRFPKDDAPIVAAGSRMELPLIVGPKRRPWVGPDHRYELTVTARPQAGSGDPKTVTAQYTHHPLFESWAPVWKAIVAVVVVLALLVGAGIVVESGVMPEFSRRVQSGSGMMRGASARIPGLGPLLRLSPDAEPRPDPNCRLTLDFQQLAEASGELVGTCVTRAAYDGFGNASQYTTNGVLFWARASNTPYFLKDECLYAFVEGKTEVMHGPDRCVRAIT